MYITDWYKLYKQIEKETGIKITETNILNDSGLPYRVIDLNGMKIAVISKCNIDYCEPKDIKKFFKLKVDLKLGWRDNSKFYILELLKDKKTIKFSKLINLKILVAGKI